MKPITSTEQLQQILQQTYATYTDKTIIVLGDPEPVIGVLTELKLNYSVYNPDFLSVESSMKKYDICLDADGVIITDSIFLPINIKVLQKLLKIPLIIYFQ